MGEGVYVEDVTRLRQTPTRPRGRPKGALSPGVCDRRPEDCNWQGPDPKAVQSPTAGWELVVGV